MGFYPTDVGGRLLFSVGERSQHDWLRNGSSSLVEHVGDNCLQLIVVHHAGVDEPTGGRLQFKALWVYIFGAMTPALFNGCQVVTLLFVAHA